MASENATVFRNPRTTDAALAEAVRCLVEAYWQERRRIRRAISLSAALREGILVHAA